jgi:hypothetical protein
MKYFLIVASSVFSIVGYSQVALNMHSDTISILENANGLQYCDQKNKFSINIKNEYTKSTNVVAILKNLSKKNMGIALVVDTGNSYENNKVESSIYGYWSLGMDPNEGIDETQRQYLIELIPPNKADSFHIDISVYRKYSVYFRLCLNMDYVVYEMKKETAKLDTQKANNRIQILGYGYRKGYDINTPGLFADLQIEYLSKTSSKNNYIYMYKYIKK